MFSYAENFIRTHLLVHIDMFEFQKYKIIFSNKYQLGFLNIDWKKPRHQLGKKMRIHLLL